MRGEPEGVTQWTPSARTQDASDRTSGVISARSSPPARSARPQSSLLECLSSEVTAALRASSTGRSRREKTPRSLPPRLPLPRSGPRADRQRGHPSAQQRPRLALQTVRGLRGASHQPAVPSGGPAERLELHPRFCWHPESRVAGSAWLSWWHLPACRRHSQWDPSVLRLMRRCLVQSHRDSTAQTGLQWHHLTEPPKAGAGRCP